MANVIKQKRPYINLSTYLKYKQRGVDILKEHENEIITLAEQESYDKEAKS